MYTASVLVPSVTVCLCRCFPAAVVGLFRLSCVADAVVAIRSLPRATAGKPLASMGPPWKWATADWRLFLGGVAIVCDKPSPASTRS